VLVIIGVSCTGSIGATDEGLDTRQVFLFNYPTLDCTGTLHWSDGKAWTTEGVSESGVPDTVSTISPPAVSCSHDRSRSSYWSTAGRTPLTGMMVQTRTPHSRTPSCAKNSVTTCASLASVRCLRGSHACRAK